MSFEDDTPSDGENSLRSHHPCVSMTKRSKSGTTGMLLTSQMASETTLEIHRRGRERNQDIDFDMVSVLEARKTTKEHVVIHARLFDGQVQ